MTALGICVIIVRSPVTHELGRSDPLTGSTYWIGGYSRASKGFDRDCEAGEASRMAMRQMAKLNLNANDNLALAA